MAQFDIFKNKNPDSDVQFFISLQADAVSLLNTTIVAPLRKASAMKDKYISKIHIRTAVKGEDYIAFISELAAIPNAMLGKFVNNSSSLRTEIISAIDLLFTGF